VKVECSADISRMKCVSPCLLYLDCGHKCIGTCGTCKDGKHISCPECIRINITQ